MAAGASAASAADDHRRNTSVVDGPRRAVKSTVEADGTRVLISVGRAILARFMFIVHSLVTIWHTTTIEKRDGVWGFALLSLLIVFEGSYTIIMRAGDERKWFCTSLLLYIVATAPPIWLLETKLCEWRREYDLLGESRIEISGPEEELQLQLLEQLLLVVLIIGRWLLPKGDISREQLSQILLAYLAISSDIVEFFDVFKEKAVYNNINVQQIVLAAWTLSLLQFPFVLTVSRARKMRVAITKTYEELIMPHTSPPNFWEVFYDVDIWAIILANSLQDIPFLLVRLYLMLQHGLITYTMIFFTCKNALIIALQTYRAFILLNDRYIRPKPPDFDMLDSHAHHTRDHHQRKPTGHRKRKSKRDKSEERQHLFSPHRERSQKRQRHRMDTLEETTA
ncbi:Transmembrane protein 26 [Trichostrongylus colubriformis]|uniref:Transmembrane protein 26 n=1 Tax=Trichostrongylus colubriformis TaxID=6319 RepID=A0AAN8IM74_TRICO